MFPIWSSTASEAAATALCSCGASKACPQGSRARATTWTGVNYSKSYMFDFPLFDIERIEVLKGPQGTLYGRNTIGGVINVLTKKPDNEAVYRLGATVGSYEKKELQGAVRVPLIEDILFMSFAGMASEENGYMENDTPTDGPDGKDGRHMDGKAGRLKLRFLPTDKWDITLSLDGQWHDDGAYSGSRTERNPLVMKGLVQEDDPYHYSHDYEGRQENDCWGTSLNAAYAMDFAELSSVTGYRDYDSDERIDADFSPLDLMRKKFRVKEKDFSQEFRLVSVESPSPLRWQAGVNYFHLDTESTNTNIYRPGMANSPSNPLKGTGERAFIAENTNDGAAVFGQATYVLWEQLDLTAGLRYEHERAETDSILRDTLDGQSPVQRGSLSSSKDFSAVLPKLAVAWHVTDGQMLYATFAGAHRSGGFNGFSAPAGEEAYGEEFSWLYEVGTKSMFFDERLMLNLSLFHIDIQDEQLALFNARNMQSYVANAGKSHRQGVEAEAKYAVLPGLELSGSFTYMDARFDEYEDGVTGVDYKGNQVFCVPEYTYNLAAQYRFPLEDDLTFFARADLAGVGPRYFDDENNVRSPAYELVHLKVGMEWRGLDCYVWVKNVFDQEYRSFENTQMGIAEYGPPRTIGLTVGYRF